MSEPIIVAAVAGLAGAITGAIPSLLLIRHQARKQAADTEKSEAEAADTITDAALALVEPLKKRISELELCDADRLKEMRSQAERISKLEEQVKKQRKEFLKLLNGAARLQHQVKSLGADPVFIVPVYIPQEDS